MRLMVEGDLFKKRDEESGEWDGRM